jgi:hypothetical protein
VAGGVVTPCSRFDVPIDLSHFICVIAPPCFVRQRLSRSKIGGQLWAFHHYVFASSGSNRPRNLACGSSRARRSPQVFKAPSYITCPIFVNTFREIFGKKF